MQPTTTCFILALFLIHLLVFKSAGVQGFEGCGGDENGLFLPAGEDQDDTCSTLSSDSCVKIKLDCPVRFKEETTKKIYVCENGVVCFGKPYYDYTPPLNNQKLRKLKNKFCLAPYHADIDLHAGGKVCYHTYDVASPEVSDQENAVLKAEELVWEYYGRQINALLVIVVTWVDARRTDGAENETATFQIIYVTNGFHAYAFYIYLSNSMNYKKGPIFIGLLENKFANGLFDGGNSSFYLRPDRCITSGFLRQGETSFDLTPTGYPTIDPRCACKIWHKREFDYTAIYNIYLSNMPDCPCTLALVRNDLRFRRVPSYYSNVLSYALESFFGAYALSGKTCNYRNNNRGQFINGGKAGAFEKFNQLGFFGFFRYLYFAEDLQYQWLCCKRSKSCDLFNEVRPRIRTCTSRANAGRGGGSGDPHISTIDGQDYTMNGHGEYILVLADDLQIQARTSPAAGQDETVSAATVFSAFAVQVGAGCWIQAELQNQRSLKVLVGTNNTNWEDASSSYQSSKPIKINCGKAERQNQTLVLVFNTTGVTFKVIVGTGLLQMEIKLDKKYSSKISGLLGNFDGDKTNDYKPRGSSSTLPDTSAERQILVDFAKTWITTAEESIFSYDNVLNHTSFHFPDKIPAFYDELDKTDPKFKKAEQICENSSQCIFDYMLTNNEELAKETSVTFQQAAETRAVLDNQVPSVTITAGTTIVNDEHVLYANLKTNYVITFDGDDDGPFTFELVETTAQATLQNNGSVNLVVNDTIPVTLSVAARDNVGAVSPVVSVVIVLCTGCNSHGECDNAVIREDDNRTTDDFKYSTCDCEPYWEGNDCEEDVDGCEGNPCGFNRTCQDVAADVHKKNSSDKGYTCGPCPTGYQTDGDKCKDIDECKNTTDCTQSCTNTDGSFTCQCNAGYRLAEDGKTCNDINECEEFTDNCEQICTNTNGTFTCTCIAGFTFVAGTSKCKKDVPPTGCGEFNCSKADGCTLDEDNTPVCFCNKGYEIQQDKTCANVDECKASPCRHNCTDTVGSFMCSCFNGYKLHDDKISCLGCNHPFYGDNCEDECIVGRGFLKCDPIRGSLCKNGWLGVDCDKDINECLDPNTPDLCEEKNKICTNTIGSYECTCLTGYQIEDGICVDMNECADTATNKCEQICINTVGSFSCSCRDDFVVDPNEINNCTAIDECAEGISGCEHFCKNNVLQSGFTCGCQEGYSLNVDGKTCSLVSDPCENFKDNGCTQVCKVVSDEPKCSCKIGFVLAEDGRTCKDVNECDSQLNLNGCTEPNSCENLNGGYRCSCGNGFKLENDVRTCTGCDSSHFGENCASECACSEGAVRCDPNTGCVCKEGWAGEKCDIDINECKTSPCTGDNEDCINTKGSYTCNCKTGYSRNQDKVCEDTDECGSALHNCAQICTNTPGSFQCSCHPGYQQEGKLCTDINECAGQHSCEQTCENADGSYSCTCNTGYKLNLTDRRSCIPEEQCPSENPCQAKTECAVVSGQNKCSCLEGYQFVTQAEVRCEDISECSGDPSPCSQACTEQPGGFTCSCDQPGYELDTDQVTCIVCSDGKYGAECSQDCTCNTENAVSCSNVDGNCTCKEGWSGSTCAENVNECDTPSVHQCPNNSRCVDTDGSFNCQCEPGYIKSDNACQVCSGAKYGADCATGCTCVQTNTEICNNVNGSCTCKQGWEGSDCNQNINECIRNSSICASVPNSRCIDTHGSYSCACFVGFIKSLTDDTCSACERGTYGVDCGKICQCNASNYESCNAVNGDCTCKAGWQSNDCNENIDECATNSFDCPPSSSCADTPGSYVCNCDTGYTKTVNNTCEVCSDGKYGAECSQDCTCNTENTVSCNNVDGNCTCKEGWSGSTCAGNVNECATQSLHQCPQNSQCVDNDGSFKCQCEQGYIQSGDACQVCSDGKYGAECSQDCTCNTENTVLCSNVDGKCTCKAGWRGSTCAENVNECATQSLHQCPQNSQCVDTDGSFNCQCEPGYMKSENVCQVCSDGKYGAECSQDCTCNTENTVLCNNVDGKCTCKAGWRGSTCAENVNECATQSVHQCPQNSQCVDTDGSFNCQCEPGYMKSENVCQVCVDSYGEQCVNPCNCDPKRTTECHHVTGCVCKPGFIGVNCTDIDECATATSVCQENSFCTNTAGGHTCTCNTGYIETQGNCEKCSGKRYGENCDNNCDCKDNNTVNPIQSCDHINGTCLCTAYWDGKRCESNIDECALGTDNCTKDNEGCHNTDKGFICSCNVGFVRDNNNNCVKDTTVTTTPALPGNRRRVHVEVRIDHNVNGDLKVSITYQNYLREVQYQLEIWYRKRLRPIIFYIVNLRLRQGSLIVDYAVDVPGENVPDVAAANIDLATNKEPIPVFNQKGQVTNLAIANTTVPVTPTYSDTLLCQIYEPSINNCGGEAECLVKDSKPYCEPKEEDDFALIFGLGFGIPMFLLCIAAVVLVVVFMRQRRKKLSHLKRVHRDDDSKSDSVFARQVPVRIVTSVPFGPMYRPPDLEPYAESEYSDYDLESEYRKREGQGSWNYMFGNLRSDEEYRFRRPSIDTQRGRYNY